VVDAGAVLGREFREVVLLLLAVEDGRGRKRGKGRGERYLVRNHIPMPSHQIIRAVILDDLVVGPVDLTLHTLVSTTHSPTLSQQRTKTRTYHNPPINLQLLIDKRNRKQKIPRVRKSMATDGSQVR